MAASAQTIRRLKATDLVWLGIAVLLHSVLLLIPYSIPAPPARPEAVKVTIEMTQIEEAEPAPKLPQEEPLVSPELLPLPKPLSHEPLPTSERTEAEFAVVEELEKEQADETRPIGTAILLHSASAMKWAAKEEVQPRHLGIHYPVPQPENWRPSLTQEDNSFNDMMVPARTEVVDHWLAADGSRNVVINTTTGHTICGRGQAWNPMQPLVAHVMMFRPCGGGGKRTFEMPHRGKSSRNTSK
jgi:hypothetical protein